MIAQMTQRLPRSSRSPGFRLPCVNIAAPSKRTNTTRTAMKGRMRKECAEPAPAKHGEAEEERARDDGNRGHQEVFAEHACRSAK